jgi:hypothetical protein
MGRCPSGGSSVTHQLGRRRGMERDCGGGLGRSEPTAAEVGYDDEGSDDNGGGQGRYRR